MLIELYCDKYQNDGQERGAISFHEGLNVVLGDRRAKNSIGKTTFLLAIDFALGGDQYANGSDGMLEEVGDHDVCFTFLFDGIEHSFLRNTADKDVVWSCTRQYERAKPIDLSDYRDWLGAMYGMHDLGGSFRALISPFMRIFGRPQVKLEHPLFSHDGDSQEMQLSRLLMLYGKYLPVAELDEKCAELKKSSKAFEDARKYNHITAACNSDEYKTNGRRIDAIHQELDELYESSEEGTLDLDSEKTARVSSLKSTLVQLRRQRTRYRNRMNEMKDSLSTTSFTQTKDYEELSEFFDGINIKHIEEIEQFHKGITRIMRARLKEEIEDTELAIELLDKQIDDVRAEIDEAGPISSLPKVALDRVGELTAELTHLNEANAAFERTAELKNQLKVMKRRCDSEKMDSFSQIESRINKEIEELNNRAVGPDKTSPLLEIKNPKSYNFIVPKDGGAGSKNRAVFLFDITLLAQTALPLVVHDSVGLKQIEDKNTVGLLNAYAGSTKQVFVAIDKAESYFASGETPEVIKDNTVLELSEGNELFGWSWNTNEGKRQ